MAGQNGPVEVYFLAFTLVENGIFPDFSVSRLKDRANPGFSSLLGSISMRWYPPGLNIRVSFGFKLKEER